jgi:hypothetical protein
MCWLPLGIPSPELGAGPAPADAKATPDSRLKDTIATTIKMVINFLIAFTT